MTRIYGSEDIEVLVQLWHLSDRYGRREARRDLEVGAVMTEATKHLRFYGHHLAFGCCSGSTVPLRNLGDLIGPTAMSEYFETTEGKKRWIEVVAADALDEPAP